LEIELVIANKVNGKRFNTADQIKKEISDFRLRDKIQHSLLSNLIVKFLDIHCLGHRGESYIRREPLFGIVHSRRDPQRISP
jgi:hypothetical protein